MYSDPSVTGNLGWFIWFMGELAFKWVPGTVLAIVGVTDPAYGTPLPVAPITEPVTISEVSRYVATVAPPEIYNNLFHAWGTFTAISIVVSLLFATIVVYATIRIQQIRHLEHLKFTSSATQAPVTKDVPRNLMRWRRIIEQASSNNEQDWRLAILEADIMLNELLDNAGYKGETMGDKMRNADRATFTTIDLAWEAHRARNRIAHEGAAHLINARDARTIIGLYERVFKEFRMIE